MKFPPRVGAKNPRARGGHGKRQAVLTLWLFSIGQQNSVGIAATSSEKRSMLFKNGFNVISVQIQRILMWRFWTCERSELRVRTLCNSTALAHIPLSLHYTRKCSLASTVVYLSCFQWLTHGWWSTDRCQQFLKFLKQFGRAQPPNEFFCFSRIFRFFNLWHLIARTTLITCLKISK